MKKIFGFAFMFCLAISSFAFGGGIGDNKDAIVQEKTTKLKDCVLMKDGNMYVVKGGETTDMVKAVVMSNGTKVLANGEIIGKNGETSKLENGDVMYMNGKIEKKVPGLN